MTCQMKVMYRNAQNRFFFEIISKQTQLHKHLSLVSYSTMRTNTNAQVAELFSSLQLKRESLKILIDGNGLIL